MAIRSRATAVATTLLLLVVACAEGGRLGDGQAPPLAGFRVHQADPGGGMDALLGGTLEVDLETGCVWLSSEDGSRAPVIWPEGTSISLDPVTISLPDGETAQPGDRLQGGGGAVDAAGATEGLGLDPFPAECLQTGEAMVFNAGAAIQVTPGEGMAVADTLVSRFSVPEPIGLEVIAVDPDARSVVVADLVQATVHRFGPDDYAAPPASIEGASGGGGFIHLWSLGTIRSYTRIDSEPLVYEPRFGGDEGEGVLTVLPAPNRERTWLVRSGAAGTSVELIDLVEVQVSRMMTTGLDGQWRPVGTTTDGLVLTTDEPSPMTRLIGLDGELVADVEGTALSVGWAGVALLQPDGTLVVTGARLGNPVTVDPPEQGVWEPIGDLAGETVSPPVATGAESHLVKLASEPQGPGRLVVVDAGGAAEAIAELPAGSQLATWGRGGDWVVLVDGAQVSVISLEDGERRSLGELIPDGHLVLTAG